MAVIIIEHAREDFDFSDTCPYKVFDDLIAEDMICINESGANICERCWQPYLYRVKFSKKDLVVK